MNLLGKQLQSVVLGQGGSDIPRCQRRGTGKGGGNKREETRV